MLEALWSIEFGSNYGFLGAGVVIFETGRIFGGDAQYYYTGTYDISDGKINAQVNVTRYSEHGVSVFGTTETEFRLNITGQIQEPVMNAEGYQIDAPNNRIALRFTKRAELP
jgi:hypothetical protein